MAVIPRQARRRAPYGNPNGPNSQPPNSHSNNAPSEGYHGNYRAPPSRLFSSQTVLLLLVGVGVGYFVTISTGRATQTEIGLNAIVKNLEQQQQRAAASLSNDGVSSSMNMMDKSRREETIQLRGDGRSNHAVYNHRSLSSAHSADKPEVSEGEDAEESEPVEEEQTDAAEESEPAEEEQTVTAVTAELDEEVLSQAEKNFLETQKLLGSQSVPTATTPRVMKTPNLPDSQRKRIVVTGGAGFVGSHLVDKLMMEGHEVTVVDNFFTGQKKNIQHWMHHPRFSLVVHDVTEPIMLEVDEIYHLACPASPPHYQYNPVKTIKTSTMGTLNMLGLAKRVNAKMLLTSTSEVYGDPEVHPQPESYWGNVNTIGPRACYDEGKRVAETMMYSYSNQNDVDVRVARIFNTFGPRMHPNDGRVVSNFIIQSLQEKPMTIYGDGSQTRSFQYVSDLVDGLHALMNGKYDQPVNLGNPDEYTMKHFAEHVKKVTESGSEITFLPATKDDPSQRKPDITTAKRELDWSPKVTVTEGLEQTIAYFSRVLAEDGEIIPTGPNAAQPHVKRVAE